MRACTRLAALSLLLACATMLPSRTATAAEPAGSAAKERTADNQAAQELGDELQVMNEQVVVLPKDVYIGDQMEVRYTFATSLNLSATLDLPAELEPPQMPELTILSMTLSEADSTGANGYVLSVQCIPWKSGAIDIPPLDMELPLALDIPPILIQSILTHTGKTELQAVRPPVLIPGTTWVIYLIVIVLALLSLALIVLFVHLHRHSLTFLEFLWKLFSTPNYRRGMRALKRLAKKSATYSDQDFAALLSHTLRTYLTKRFSYHFDVVSSSEILSAYIKLMADTEDAAAEEMMEEIERILVRTDYVRFSGSTTTEAALSPDERADSLAAAKQAVRYLEKGEQAHA